MVKIWLANLPSISAQFLTRPPIPSSRAQARDLAKAPRSRNPICVLITAREIPHRLPRFGMTRAANDVRRRTISRGPLRVLLAYLGGRRFVGAQILGHDDGCPSKCTQQ